jgi:tetratricopeptide (TPR) repeat protein
MKQSILLLLSLSVFMMSCNSPELKDEKTLAIEKITALELQAFDDEQLSYNHKVALETIKEYQIFIEKYPQDSASIEYMYMGAQLCKSINLFGEAVRKYKAFADTYPTDPRAAKALFMVGMIYETDLKDTDKAKEAYELFVSQFPNHDLVDDAKFLIQNLSLSDDDLIKMLEERSKKDSAAV